MIWINILQRSKALQNLKSPSNVNFAIKSFQDFTLYVNIDTLNTECRSDQEQEMWMWNTWWKMLMITSWEKGCVRVNISWWIRNLKGQDTKSSITQWKRSKKLSWAKNLIIFQQFEMCSKSESGIWLHFEKYRRRRVHIFSCTRKHYPTGSIQTCVHQGRLSKAKRFSPQNWRQSLVAEKEWAQSGGSTS